MIHLKDDSVLIDGLKQEMYFALGIADAAYAAEGLECVITAGLDGKHMTHSKHAEGFAVDLRSSNLSPDQHSRISASLKRLEKYGFDFVDESSHATSNTTAEHFHIEYDPKFGERLNLLRDNPSPTGGA